MQRTTRRGMTLKLCLLLIICILFGCGKKQDSSENVQTDEDKSVTEQKQDSDISKSKAENGSLMLMDQYLKVSDGSDRCYHRLAVTGGDNELVKNVIESSMRRLENQSIEENGSSFVNVQRNDDLLVSYNCGFVGSDYTYTNYNKTINATNGSELELSDIVVDMDMLPKAMYAECYQIRDDYDDFIDFINNLIEEDALYWTVNNYGITLKPDDVHTAEVLAQGAYHPVKYYGFTVFLSYAKYPELFNGEYFVKPGGEMTMNTLGDSKASLSEEQLLKLKEYGKSNEDYSYSNALFYAQDLNLIMYSDRSFDYFNQLCLYDFENNIGCTEKIGDGVTLAADIVPYLAEIKGKKYLIYSIAYYDYDEKTGKDIYNSETFVFRIEKKGITLTDRVDGLMNLGGGNMSTSGFYMNSYEEERANGMEETEWMALPMFMITDQGKIVQKN